MIALIRSRLYLLAVLCLLGACSGELVDESYATVGQKSINGADAFRALLAGKNHTVFEAGFLTRRVRRDADLIVFFEREHLADEDYFRHLEAWLYGIEPDSLSVPKPEPGADTTENEESEETEETAPLENAPPEEPAEPEIEIGPSDEPTDVRDAHRAPPGDWRLALAQDAEDESADEETAGDEAADDEAQSDEAPAEIQDRYRTVLYFLKDTDASIAFWELLGEQLKSSKPHQVYCAHQLGARVWVRGMSPPPAIAPFSARAVAHEDGRPLTRLRYDASVFRQRISRFPVRGVPGPVISHFGQEPPTARVLLQTAEGEDLIRELDLPYARLILVYNSESFLNHSMVRRENRRMAADLLRYALYPDGDVGIERTIAVVTNRPIPAVRAAEDEIDMLRFLTVYPINLVVFHFLALLALFLLSRWPHRRPPLQTAPTGSREFLEHIKALGARVARTGNAHQGLEPLITYKQKTSGRDYSEILRKLEAVNGEPESSNPDSGNGPPK